MGKIDERGLSYRKSTVKHVYSGGLYYSSSTTKSDDSVTQTCLFNIDTQKDACF